jgi:putative tryptophan/tyrosine transport system substrate-binding protein
VAGIGTIDAAMRATQHVPIVMTFGVTASEAGVLGSLARPGRNVTGLTGDVTTEVMSKRLELLREVAPHARRVVALHAPIPDSAAYIADFEAGARQLRFSLQYVEVRHVADLDAAFAKVRNHRPDALYCGGDPLTMRVIPRIVEFARQHRIPSIHGPRQFADAGGLIAYGVSLTAIYRRAAEYVHSILNGASPSDLPIERPPKYDLVINLKAARALSMTIPQSVLARADHVIE